MSAGHIWYVGVAVLTPTEILCGEAYAYGDYMCILSLPSSSVTDGFPSLGGPCSLEEVEVPDGVTNDWAFTAVGFDVYAVPNECVTGSSIHRFNHDTKDWTPLDGFTETTECWTSDMSFGLSGCLFILLHCVGPIENSCLWRFCPTDSVWTRLPLPAIMVQTRTDRRERYSLEVFVVTNTTAYFRVTEGNAMFSFNPGAGVEWQCEEPAPEEVTKTACPIVFAAGEYIVAASEEMDGVHIYDPIAGEWVSDPRSIKALLGEKAGAEFTTLVGPYPVMGGNYLVELVTADFTDWMSVCMLDARVSGVTGLPLID
ncbi:hypothetical protein KIPB_006637 [Kipferlia bialata]|uniref:Uncharacterized protein n=1 Tax=Kipferlia bialata TaxID=797122 RepID=A0A9K3CZ90_9EUKA|nr:hypothetical protein KIPB_006637 [Kipferlia bialata]|eukprot:g6637.t1